MFGRKEIFQQYKKITFTTQAWKQYNQFFENL